jgi:hypothetical protein
MHARAADSAGVTCDRTSADAVGPSAVAPAVTVDDGLTAAGSERT